MLKEIENYIKAKQKLEDALCHRIYLGLDLHKRAKWNLSDGFLEWESKGETYYEEARLYAEYEDVSIIRVFSCTGDEFLMVFLNNNKVEE